MVRNDPEKAFVRICFHGELFEPHQVTREANGDFTYCIQNLTKNKPASCKKYKKSSSMKFIQRDIKTGTKGQDCLKMAVYTKIQKNLGKKFGKSANKKKWREIFEIFQLKTPLCKGNS